MSKWAVNVNWRARRDKLHRRGPTVLGLALCPIYNLMTGYILTDLIRFFSLSPYQSMTRPFHPEPNPLLCSENPSFLADSDEKHGV